ncbi:hypothetical protein AOLI_G00012490 [Acnodon oligacanthus]
MAHPSLRFSQSTGRWRRAAVWVCGWEGPGRSGESRSVYSAEVVRRCGRGSVSAALGLGGPVGARLSPSVWSACERDVVPALRHLDAAVGGLVTGLAAVGEACLSFRPLAAGRRGRSAAALLRAF